jgi:tetratricopeptide (TPR) repeat protein
MRKLLILSILVLCCIRLFAEDQYSNWWQTANKYYVQKQYDSAAFYYEKLAQLNPKDAVVYYNLGNAYYRLNQVGLAVLNYERALRINPDYKEAQDNLSVTQSRIANKIPYVPDIFFIRWWGALTDAHKATTWAIAAVIAFILALTLVLIKRFRMGVTIPSQLIGILSFLWLIFIVLSVFSARNNTEHDEAVVMQNDAPLLNTLQGKTQSLVPEGTTVKFSDVQGNWVMVRLPDGRSGWMQKNLLTKI